MRNFATEQPSSCTTVSGVPVSLCYTGADLEGFDADR